MSGQPTRSPGQPTPAAPPHEMRANVPVYEASALFCTARTVIIRHSGMEYRLMITRQNKLILTK